jgi:peptidoglycan LD-endopeptidase CwlK
MGTFSTASLERLTHVHPDLRRVFEEVVKHYDCSILCGHRGEEEQHIAFAQGRSKLDWPDSKHNGLPSKAVDAAPYPVDWNDAKRFYLFAGFVLGTAKQMGVNLRWGGDWDRDWDLSDNRFNDWPHFELYEE